MASDTLQSLETFLKVAQAGSLSAAARTLAVSQSAVADQIARLEAAVGAPLLVRRRSGIRLTPAGEAVLAGGPPVVERLAALLARGRPEGGLQPPVITIGTPPSFAKRILAPAVAAFLQKHPHYRIVLLHDDGFSHHRMPGIDMAIRLFEALKSSSEIGTSLGRLPQRLVAAPAYVAQHGTPQTPRDLVRHACLTAPADTPTWKWTFSGPGGRQSVHVRGNLRSNIAEAMCEVAVRGHGIALYPDFIVEEYLRTGALIELLPAYRPLPLAIFAVYPAPRDRLPPHMRALLDFLRRWIARELKRAAPPGE